MSNALLAALSGTNYTETHGCVSSEMSHHPVQAILDDDLAGTIGRFIEGVNINSETLAIDLINEVGPIPAHFLGTAHTRKMWTKEHFVPATADRLTYPEWINSGKKGCLEYAKEKMAKILATHKGTPLTSSQEEDIENILQEARKYYRQKGLISDAEMQVYQTCLKAPGYPFE
jgi:trimethylamine--corrinoid protein Co-methyltransferase